MKKEENDVTRYFPQKKRDRYHLHRLHLSSSQASSWPTQMSTVWEDLVIYCEEIFINNTNKLFCKRGGE